MSRTSLQTTSASAISFTNLDIPAHQVELMFAVLRGRMEGKLRWWKPKDQPAAKKF
ncbi:MAG TPA: hypothetical protein VHE34_13755 [Puia sp.]|uniref:hypothetical protein n=1 Tax=Puia sp. TaxID=2045100 RepID=UPI002C868C1D|nr:hypothetical protein [Puia sp.]HVU96289.1 hypothetical protein [Puia sp.]